MSSTPFHLRMLALCVAVHASQAVIGPDRLFDAGALYGPAVLAGEWWRLLTAGFLHAGLLHLAVNMFSLVMLGRGLEGLLDRSARWMFPFLYLVSILGGSVGALLLDFDVPAVGASGAIFGLLAAAVVIPWRLGLGWNGFGVVPWLALNLVFTFADEGISRGGHLGGLVAGGVAAAVLSSRLR